MSDLDEQVCAHGGGPYKREEGSKQRRREVVPSAAPSRYNRKKTAE